MCIRDRPLGVGAAIYLTEYASNRRFVAAIEFATETLTGIPSIIFGLVGMLFFCQRLGLQASLLAGSLTLVIVTIPTIIRTTQESLKTVPQDVYKRQPGTCPSAYGSSWSAAHRWTSWRCVLWTACLLYTS